MSDSKELISLWAPVGHALQGIATTKGFIPFAADVWSKHALSPQDPCKSTSLLGARAEIRDAQTVRGFVKTDADKYRKHVASQALRKVSLSDSVQASQGN